MKKPAKLSEQVLGLLYKRLENEYTAFYTYRAASHWCQNNGFAKAAKYFEKESADELEHAKGIENYITDWNTNPELPAISKPKTEFKSLVEIIEKAYDLEYNLYLDYEETSMKLFKEGEVAVFDFIQAYRKIQNDSVIEYSDMFNVLEGVDANKMNLLLLEEQLFGE